MAHAVPTETGPVTAAQTAYLEAFDRFLRSTGPAKLNARHDMRASLACMFAETGRPVPRHERWTPRGRHGPAHDTG